jgi:hypothetical protein
MSAQFIKKLEVLKGASGMVFQRTGRQFKPVFALGLLMTAAAPVLSQVLAPPPFDMMNRHHVNMTSGTVAPNMTDVAIGGTYGLSHSITATNSNFLNWEGGYGPIGP